MPRRLKVSVSLGVSVSLIVRLVVILLILAAGYLAYRHWLSPTRLLVVNPLPVQAAELEQNAARARCDVTCVPMTEARGFDGYDVVVMYGRGLYLDSLQTADLEDAARRGTPVYTVRVHDTGFAMDRNITRAESDSLRLYFRNPCRANYVGLMHRLRALATPHKLGLQTPPPPVILPDGLFYHLAEGCYFDKATALEEHLRDQGLYHESAPKVALVSGLNFPVEGNRAHIDTLVSRLTARGFNIYPLSASGRNRARLLRQVAPDAIVYLPMGRLGNDSLAGWCHREGIPLFTPFPVTQTRQEWLDPDKGVAPGTLNARIIMPEIDGAMSPVCIATQDAVDGGPVTHNPIEGRMDAFVEQFSRFMALRHKSNADKRVAVVCFRSPGRDGMLASGMEVVPSLYSFLKHLRSEGYDVSGLPPTLEAFDRQLSARCEVTGDYAPAAMRRFMDSASPVWVDADTYREWADDVLMPESYAEVERHYGPAPGAMMARGDSIAVAALRYGNILLMPQPRSLIGDDDARLADKGMVPPPHSYVAAYLYMLKGFDADALIHFGTHGNLEFIPGKSVALRDADWADALTGNRPHFYFYNVANTGESVIARRRSRAVLVSHLPAPYADSGLGDRYAALARDIDDALANPSHNTPSLKARIVGQGLHSDLGLDSVAGVAYGADDLRRVSDYLAELATEKVPAAHYVMGRPYSERDMLATLTAICADRLAYDAARRDRDAGLISDNDLHDNRLVARRYLPAAKAAVRGMSDPCVRSVRDALLQSPEAEFRAMTSLLSGRPAAPSTGGDPVRNPEALPTGRNIFSINPDATPSDEAWTTGARLADSTLHRYRMEHGHWPRKVSFSLWAGEFISTQGATVAQALRMLGVEPVRDRMGRVIDLRLTPAARLGRPRIDVMIQVSGQLRDIAASRLLLITDAVRLASGAMDGDSLPNYVAEGTLAQEKAMVDGGIPPREARRLSAMRVFGPVSSGYSTGMLARTENSGAWTDRSELADTYVGNMSAIYGDTLAWGTSIPSAMRAAVSGTDVIVQPRQSNTWGPVSLDHVYEFAGSLSLLATHLGGQEPQMLMADYRNPSLPRMQDASMAVAAETRVTLLNLRYISTRMEGGASTAGTFGEMARNIFGWTVTRPSVLAPGIYDEMFDVYVRDIHGLGIERYFDSANPAALQELTAVMLESARKGYWHPTDRQLALTASLHARLTARHGDPGTEFVSDNIPLQQFIARSLPQAESLDYTRDMARTDGVTDRTVTLSRQDTPEAETRFSPVTAAIILLVIGIILAAIIISRRKSQSH